MNSEIKFFTSSRIHTEVLQKISKKTTRTSDNSIVWIKNNRAKWLKLEKKYIYKNTAFDFKLLSISELHIPKKRKIYKPDLVDKIVLMKISKIITEKYNHKFSKTLYSYRPRCGQHRAIQALQKYLKRQIDKDVIFIFKTDIVNYGESIDKLKLINKIKSDPLINEDKLTYDLLIKAINQKAEPNNDVVGLPSGSPIVPFLSNFYLTELDKSLENKNIFYGRFGDDILMASHNHQQILNVIEILKNKIKDHKLELNNLKTDLIYLTRKTHLKSTPSNINYKKTILWLGHRINKDGLIQPKKETLLSFRKVLNNEIVRVCQMAREKLFDLNEQECLLRSFFENLKSHPDFHKYKIILESKIYNEFFCRYKSELAKFFVSKISHHLKISKKKAWILFHKIQLKNKYGKKETFI